MPTLSHITTVHRPPHAVMEVFFDWGQDASWRPAVRRMTVHPSGPAVVGQRIVEELRFAGVTVVTPTQVESVHPYRVVWSGGNDALTIRGWREIEPTGASACRVKEVVDVELKGALRLLGPLLTPMYRRTMRVELAGLARHLERVPVG